ncbi:hypothetical protein PGTUg99_035953 [Puccinia graminis f. sp. tritici]|uniref:Uncharacterized protein n=1 Tax=Puccinia graminis f. sp. tritici TaxID=56615 RepID=A0A5B0N5Y3_PUCGR|nr:hypothetical protein PGTUg99_035953 [Puccinia graminis f. sp. tritici]
MVPASDPTSSLTVLAIDRCRGPHQRLHRLPTLCAAKLTAAGLLQPSQMLFLVVLCPTASRFLIKAKLPSTSSSSRQVLSNFFTVFRRYLHADPPRFYTSKPTVINDFDIDGLDAIPQLPSVF